MNKLLIDNVACLTAYLAFKASKSNLSLGAVGKFNEKSEKRLALAMNRFIMKFWAGKKTNWKTVRHLNNEIANRLWSRLFFLIPIFKSPFKIIFVLFSERQKSDSLLRHALKIYCYIFIEGRFEEYSKKMSELAEASFSNWNSINLNMTYQIYIHIKWIFFQRSKKRGKLLPRGCSLVCPGRGWKRNQSNYQRDVKSSPFAHAIYPPERIKNWPLFSRPFQINLRWPWKRRTSSTREIFNSIRVRAFEILFVSREITVFLFVLHLAKPRGALLSV